MWTVRLDNCFPHIRKLIIKKTEDWQVAHTFCHGTLKMLPRPAENLHSISTAIDNFMLILIVFNQLMLRSLMMCFVLATNCAIAAGNLYESASNCSNYLR